MLNPHRTIFAFWLTFAFLALPAGAQDRPTGLLFSEPEVLQAIPLQAPPSRGEPLPPKMSLRTILPPIGDQGRQNSCVGWASGYALKTLQEEAERQWGIRQQSGSPDYSHVFSPSYVYNQVRIGVDNGAYLVNALDLLCDKGCATWQTMPYDERTTLTIPSREAHDNARGYICRSYRRVNPRSGRELKEFLFAQTPVIIGAAVDRSFMKLKQGEVWSSFATGESPSGHAMLVTGYSDELKAFEVINSWGTGWGSDGFGWIGYEHFRNSVREAYVVFDVTVPRQTPPATPQPERDARSNAVKSKLLEVIIKIRYSERIDGTRKNKVLGQTIGTVGVEYMLDDARIQIEDVVVTKNSDSLLGGSTTVVVKANLSGKYREKHFRGVGSEYHTKHEEKHSGVGTFTFEASGSGARLIDKQIEGTSGQPAKLLLDGAAKELTQAISSLR